MKQTRETAVFAQDWSVFARPHPRGPAAQRYLQPGGRCEHRVQPVVTPAVNPAPAALGLGSVPSEAASVGRVSSSHPHPVSLLQSPRRSDFSASAGALPSSLLTMCVVSELRAH